MHNLIIKKISLIEFYFTNPVPLDLNIDSLSLIIESKECYQFKLKLFDLVEKDKCSFTIPSLASNFKIEMGFIIEKFGRFQLIGIYNLIKMKLITFICIYIIINKDMN